MSLCFLGGPKHRTILEKKIKLFELGLWTPCWLPLGCCCLLYTCKIRNTPQLFFYETIQQLYSLPTDFHHNPTHSYES